MLVRRVLSHQDCLLRQHMSDFITECGKSESVCEHTPTHTHNALSHPCSLTLTFSLTLSLSPSHFRPSSPHEHTPTPTLNTLTPTPTLSFSLSLSLVLVQHVEKVEDAVASESRTLGSAGGRWTHQSPVLGSLEARRAKKLVRVRACESE